LTAGEIIPRTFALYRNNFGTFVGLSAVAALLMLCLQIPMQLFPAALGATGGHHQIDPAKAVAALFLMVPVILAVWLATMFVFCLIYGAMFSAVADLRAGRPVGVTRALEETWPLSGRLLGSYLLVALRVVGWFLLFALAVVALIALVAVAAAAAHIKTPAWNSGGSSNFAAYGVLLLLVILVALAAFAFYVWAILWLYARYLLFVPAVLAEGLGAGAAIDRSVQLSKGSRGRIYVLLIAVFLLSIVAVVPVIPFMALAFHARMAGGPHMLAVPIAELLVISVVQILLTHPVLGIGMALCYYDLIERRAPPVVVATSSFAWPEGAAPVMPAADPEPLMRPAPPADDVSI
jgi:uncharacterized membrane protein